MISRSQCRAARALLDWTQDDLAQRARVSVTALRNFERGATVPVTNNLLALQAAMEGVGIVFMDGDEPGVRLRATAPSAVPGGKVSKAKAKHPAPAPAKPGPRRSMPAALGEMGLSA